MVTTTTKKENKEPVTAEEVAATLAALRGEVRRRRERLSTRLPGQEERGGSADFSIAELQRSVQEINELWSISAHFPLLWTSKVGHALSFMQRVVRVLLRWYINPIVEQQNNYNAALSRAVVQIVAYEERLGRDWDHLSTRLDRLEALLINKIDVHIDNPISKEEVENLSDDKSISPATEPPAE